MSSKQPKKRRKPLELPKIHSADGLTKDSSPLSEHQEVIASTTLPNTSKLEKTAFKQRRSQRNKNNQSATAESPQSDKETTSNVKSHTCEASSQITTSSPISDRESTSREKGCVPSWSLQAKESSPKLWLPIETGCVALHSNWLNGSFNSMESNSWFSMKTWNPPNNPNLQKTFSPSSMFSIAESMEKESTKKQKKTKERKKPSANVCRRVRLRPQPEVASTLRKWFGCVRFTYNWTLGCIKNNQKEYKINTYWLRKRFINECNIPKDKRWLLDAPKHVRDTAIIDLVQGFETNFKKKREQPDHRFEMKFRRKKDIQSITIPSDAIKSWDTEMEEMKMFPSYIKNKIKFHCRNVPSSIAYDCRLVMDRLGRFYLCIPTYVSCCENQTAKDTRKEWCSIDPGVRTFLTIYSPTVGTCYKIGDKDISRIFRLCKWLDKMCQGKKTHSWKKRTAQERLRLRIRHLVDEVHWKAINFICSNFSNVIIPPFEVSQMIKRSNRKITKKSVRQMVCWKHYTFRTRLQNYAKRFNTFVHVKGEEYTSKTCSHCMNVKANLGGAKVYKCCHCHLEADRDVMGARNIFLKNASVR